MVLDDFGVIEVRQEVRVVRQYYFICVSDVEKCPATVPLKMLLIGIINLI